ncbi:MAG TPA: glycosyltransferase [Solirubrobacterales bacterium]|nr:glycosyltransferase [Solirubrobacterales bacterium]
MRIVLFTHGTRGDVAPIVSLGWHLSKGGHEVTVAVPGEFREFAERAGLRTAPLPFDLMAWLRTAEGQRLLHSGGIPFIRGLTREYDRRAASFDEAYEAAAHGAEAVVGNHVTGDRAMALGDAMGIPMAIFFPYPLTPSREYASLTLTKGRLRSDPLCMASHELNHRLWWRQVAPQVNDFRGGLGLPPSPQPTYRRLMKPDHLVLYSLSASIFPRPSDWPAHCRVTAPWRLPEALRADLDEGLPADLEDWLDAGSPPVFLGFGSMPVLDPGPLLDDIAAVTEALGCRAIVSENCVPGGAGGALPSHLRSVGAVDHDRLFPRCAAVVHHGGIGSVATSLGAGRPTMVCSVFADQPWWGEHMKRLGVGAHVPFRKLDRRLLESGLRTALEPDVVRRSAALGEAIRAEGDGLPAAARTLEDWLRAPGRETAPAV